MRALRRLQKVQEQSPFVFTSERGSPFTTGGSGFTIPNLVGPAPLKAALRITAPPRGGWMRASCSLPGVQRLLDPTRLRNPNFRIQFTRSSIFLLPLGVIDYRRCDLFYQPFRHFKIAVKLASLPVELEDKNFRNAAWRYNPGKFSAQRMWTATAFRRTSSGAIFGPRNRSGCSGSTYKGSLTNLANCRGHYRCAVFWFWRTSR